MYNKVTHDVEGGMHYPKNNHERYPPIPLPPPPVRPNPMLGKSTVTTTPQPSDKPLLEKDETNHNKNSQNDITPGVVVLIGNLPNPENILKEFSHKVYLIFMIQLMITCGIVSVFVYHSKTNSYVKENPQLTQIMALVGLLIAGLTAGCESGRRKFPFNLICLGLFTFTISAVLGSFSSEYDLFVVPIALGIASLVVFALALFAIQIYFDFTTFRAGFVCCLTCFIILGFAILLQGPVNYMLDSMDIMVMILASICALPVCFYILYHTQTIVSGKFKDEINTNEYIFAALSLYDRIGIFMLVVAFVYFYIYMFIHISYQWKWLVFVIKMFLCIIYLAANADEKI